MSSSECSGREASTAKEKDPAWAAQYSEEQLSAAMKNSKLNVNLFREVLIICVMQKGWLCRLLS